ncbi:MAG TPA: hypothetical protein VGD87_04495 [Archangium sp.]
MSSREQQRARAAVTGATRTAVNEAMAQARARSGFVSVGGAVGK